MEKETESNNRILFLSNRRKGIPSGESKRKSESNNGILFLSHRRKGIPSGEPKKKSESFFSLTAEKEFRPVNGKGNPKTPILTTNTQPPFMFLRCERKRIERRA
jgi:hypothetical protein